MISLFEFSDFFVLLELGVGAFVVLGDLMIQLMQRRGPNAGWLQMTRIASSLA